MKNVIFLIFFAAALFLAIFFYRKYSATQLELELANRRITDRDTEIYRLQKLAIPSKTLPMAPTEKVTPSPSSLGQLSAAEIGRLQQKGLPHPETDLKEHLTSNQKAIIPIKGSLGGNQTLRDIQILNERYALAYFEDGHRGGYMVLRYDVQSPERITWQVLDAYAL